MKRVRLWGSVLVVLVMALMATAQEKKAEPRAEEKNWRPLFDGKTLSFTFARKPEEKKLKPPAPTNDEQSGPAALGTLSDAASTETKPPASDPKLVSPDYETIPAGPVFVKISSSDSDAPVNTLMQKRAFQIGEYVFTSLPASEDDLFEPESEPAPAATPDKGSKP